MKPWPQKYSRLVHGASLLMVFALHRASLPTLQLEPDVVISLHYMYCTFLTTCPIGYMN